MKRLALQLLALLPLPLVGLAVYWSGKRPPPLPPLVSSQPRSGAQASRAPSVKLPPSLSSGWKIQGTGVRYDKKTLFDRINGAAPAYIRAGFVALHGVEYKKQGYEDAVVVDAYDMGTPLRGLGMYATERDASYSFIEIGNEGYLASGSLNLWYGRFYIKIAGFEEGQKMDQGLKELAAGLVKALPKAPDPKTLLAPLAKLPTQGRVPHSDGYSHTALADVKGLEGAFFVDYKEGEKSHRLFVLAAKDSSAAAARLAKITAYFKGDGVKLEHGTEGSFKTVQAAGEDTTTVVLHAGSTLAGGVDLPAALVAGVRSRIAAALAAPNRK